MTREQAESIIAALVKIIVNVAKAYAPESDYLAIAFCGGDISFNNDYFEDGTEHEIRYREGLNND